MSEHDLINLLHTFVLKLLYYFPEVCVHNNTYYYYVQKLLGTAISYWEFEG